MAWRGMLSCALGAACSAGAWAQQPAGVAPAIAPGAGTASTPVAQHVVHIVTNTVADIEIVDQLSSRTSHIDDMFAIRLVSPIMVDGQIAVPAGTAGMGQVVHSAKAGWGGKAGEMIIAARYLSFDGVRIPLRRFRVGAAGEQHFGEAFAVGMVIPFGQMLVSGGEKIIPAGMRANAVVAADTAITLRQ